MSYTLGLLRLSKSHNGVLWKEKKRNDDVG